MEKKNKNFSFYWEENHKQGKTSEINIELPGFNKNEINVSIENGFINISAEKKSHEQEKGKNFYREEFFQQALRRSISLPEGANPKGLEIKIGNGSVNIRRKG
ncbi:MAG: Hsp20/alpha crystallin family protein [Candidatus Aenigmarchaeota archaeon]|nr:Hsp20/alpha crystallin family protein [Candidatus Aenigmarchaeota archaeon]